MSHREKEREAERERESRDELEQFGVGVGGGEQGPREVDARAESVRVVRTDVESGDATAPAV